MNKTYSKPLFELAETAKHNTVFFAASGDPAPVTGLFGTMTSEDGSWSF